MQTAFARRASSQRLNLLVLTTALSAALAGCGGSSSTTAASPPPPPPPPPAAFSFTLSSDKAVVQQGQQSTVTVTVQRDAGFNDAVALNVDGLPTGAGVGALSIPAGATTATLTLTAGATAPHSLPTATTVRGTAASGSATKPLTFTVRGAAGDVDTSFATGGTSIQAAGLSDDYGRALAVQGDGKVLMAGFGAFTGSGTDFVLMRHLRDGGLDPAFGSGGLVHTGFNNGGSSDEAQAVAVQADGKIIVAGASDQGVTGLDFALARYNADGTLDITFGNGGRVTTAFGNGADRIYALFIQADGKIIAAGDTSQGATGLDFALARYNADGSLDTTFGTGGQVITAIAAGAGRDSIYAITVQTVGGSARIVAVGGEGNFVAARYLGNGTLDTAFATNGKLTGVSADVIGAARGVVVTTDNKLVLAGHLQHHFTAVRLTTSGALDASFASAGIATVAVAPTNWDEATALVQQTDGKLLLGGWAYTGAGSSGDTVLLRLNADGSRDAGFADNGLRITGVASGGRNDAGQALVLQSDDRVPTVRVLQGGEANGSNHDLVLIRYWL